MPPIRVRVRRIENGGSLKASTTATISTNRGDFKIHRIKTVKRQDGDHFTSLPQEQFQKDGKICYAETVELPLEVMEEIEKAIFKELDL